MEAGDGGVVVSVLCTAVTGDGLQSVPGAESRPVAVRTGRVVLPVLDL